MDKSNAAGLALNLSVQDISGSTQATKEHAIGEQDFGKVQNIMACPTSDAIPIHQPSFCIGSGKEKDGLMNHAGSYQSNWAYSEMSGVSPSRSSIAMRLFKAGKLWAVSLWTADTHSVQKHQSHFGARDACKQWQTDFFISWISPSARFCH